MTQFREESDSLGVVKVPGNRLRRAQTKRSLEHFSIGRELTPPEMLSACAMLKKGAALDRGYVRREEFDLWATRRKWFTPAPLRSSPLPKTKELHI